WSVEAAALRDQPLQQRRRRPVVAEPSAVGLHSLEHGRQSDRVGVEHRAATMTWKAEPVTVDDVDVASSNGVAILEHTSAFVGERGHDARDDLVVADGMAREAALRGFLCSNLLDERIRNAGAAARLVAIPSGTGLLAVASHLIQPIGYRRLWTLGAALAD